MPARGERGLEALIAELLKREFEKNAAVPMYDSEVLGHGEDYVVVKWSGELFRVDAVKL